MNNKLDSLIEEYKNRKSRIKFFDANCWLGNPVTDSLGDFPDTVEKILCTMDYCGIEKAVVCSSLALNYHVVYGNSKLIDEIKDVDRLYGAAILLPGHTGELGNVSEYISFLVENKVVMVRLFPKEHNFILSDFCAGSLLRLLEAGKIPLCIWHTQTSWDEIDKLCGSYPGLPVIIEGVGRKLLYDNRIFYPLLEKHKNLFLGLHNLTNYLGLDDIIKKFGAKKFIFGTFSPTNDPEAAIMPIVYGDFSMEEKQAVAEDNLLSLIAKIKK